MNIERRDVRVAETIFDVTVRYGIKPGAPVKVYDKGGVVVGVIRKTWGVEAYRFHPVDGEPGKEFQTFHECVTSIPRGN